MKGLILALLISLLSLSLAMTVFSQTYLIGPLLLATCFFSLTYSLYQICKWKVSVGGSLLELFLHFLIGPWS